MSITPDRERKGRFTLVVVPESKSAKTRSFSSSVLGLMGIGIAGVVAVGAAVVAAIVFTPIGDRLPISNRRLEERYGVQIAGIQQKLNAVVREMDVLYSYNRKLRQALGEAVSSRDSAFTHQAQVDSSLSGGSQEPGGPEAPVPGGLQGEVAEFSAGAGLRQSGNVPGRQPVEDIPLPLIRPAEGFVTRGFDPAASHNGIDIAAAEGAPVVAAADGRVLFSGWTYEDGFTLIIAHSGGFTTVYKHNRTLLRTSGAEVRRGEVIALLGNTGVTSSGPHLHFEVRRDGAAEDPDNYLLTTQQRSQLP